MSDYIQLPLDPPYRKHYIATGVRHENGKETQVYLRWSDEGGGWYQWDIIKSRAKKFTATVTATAAAHACPGPSYYIPMKSTITVEEVESAKAKEYRRVIEDAIKVINNNE